MKKNLLFIAVAVMGFAACTKEASEVEQNTTENPAVEMVPISFSATMEQAVDPSTKATIGSGGVCTWGNGDAIAIHTKKGALATLTYNSTSGKFEGTIPASDAVEDDAIAFYPASITATGDDASVTLPSSYASAAAAAKAFPLRGVVDATNCSIEFKHLGGILRITATDVPSAVTAVDVTFPNSVTGAFVVSSEQIAAGSGSSTVTVATASAERTEGNLVLEIPVPVADYAGVALDFKVGSDVLYHKSTGNTIAIARKAYKKMASFNLEYIIIPGTKNSWNATYTNTTVMHPVASHAGWYVAENLAIDSTDEFKFVTRNGATTTWYGALVSSAQDRDKNAAKNPQVTYPTGDSNVKLTANGTYDVYFNPTVSKYCVLNHGDIWAKKICIVNSGHSTLLPYDYSNFFIHIYGVAVATAWQNFYSAVFETIDHVNYLVFDCSVENGYIPDGTNTLMLLDEGQTLKYKISITTDQSNENYGLSIIADDNYAQFTDLASPTGLRDSNYYLVGTMPGVSEATSWNTTDYLTTWDGHMLAYKGLSLTEGEYDFKFRYGNNWDSINFGLETSAAAYNLGDEITVTKDGSKPNITISIPSDGTYDFYFNIFTGKVYVVAAGGTPSES